MGRARTSLVEKGPGSGTHGGVRPATTEELVLVPWQAALGSTAVTEGDRAGPGPTECNGERPVEPDDTIRVLLGTDDGPETVATLETAGSG